VADDNGNPHGDVDGGSAVPGFTKGLAESGGRRRVRQLVVGALTAVVVLGAVAALAFTGGKAKHVAAPVAPKAGKLLGPVPPQVLFVNDKLGYAFYRSCAKPTVGDGCAALLFRTDDGAQSWQPVPLPPGVPVDTNLWQPLQANGDDVLLSWNGTVGTPTAVVVSTEKGAHWKPVAQAGATSEVPTTGFLLEAALVVDPASASGAAFIQPGGIVGSLDTGGMLPDGRLWLDNGTVLRLSADHGIQWTAASHTTTEQGTVPLVGRDDNLAQVTGPLSGLTRGVDGDGGGLTAAHALFSANDGASWDTSPALTGPPANAFCTVYLQDGSLLGVAEDGSSLVSLPKGLDTFVAVPLPSGLTSVPYCLDYNTTMLWGTTKSGDVVLGDRAGKTWTSHPLPPQKN
jgi:hypothetical protein